MYTCKIIDIKYVFFSLKCIWMLIQRDWLLFHAKKKKRIFCYIITRTGLDIETDRHVTPLGCTILIQPQPVFALTPYHNVLNGETGQTNCLLFGLTRPGIEPRIYRTITIHHTVVWTIVSFYKSLNLH